MKVLACYYTHKPGGFCKRLYRLLNALSAAGHEVYYLTLDPLPTQVSLKAEVKIIYFPIKKRSGALFWISLVCMLPILLFKEAKEIRPQRLVAFGAFYSAMWLPVRFWFRVPLILFIRSLVFKINKVNNEPILLRAMSNVLDWIGLKIASKVVCMTKSMQRELQDFYGLNAHKTVILGNDVPKVQVGQKLPIVSSIPQGSLIVGCSGVLDSRKNIGLVIDAVRICNQQNSQRKIYLLIAGNGPLYNSYADLISQQEDQHVKLLGWQEDLRHFHASCQLVVHPSLHEGVSNSLLEALASGLPVLASDCREHEELLKHNELLFKPELPTLTSKLAELRDSPSALQSIQSLCSELTPSLQFDWDKQACNAIEQTA